MISLLRLLAPLLAATLFAQLAHAQAAAAGGGAAPAVPAADQAREKAAMQSFAGLKFGIGLSLTKDNGNNDRVVSATLDENNIVRIEEEQNSVARIVLESHFFFPGTTASGLIWGHGPFVALQPGTDELIDALGMGYMVGWRRNNSTDDNSSFNLGVGVIVDPSVRILGDGIEPNQPLPANETAIRYKQTSQNGWLVMFSFGF
ncbi:hypothetical protein HCU74_00775 [Spongiibacter sp. KMU-166]|uniref:Outer membrane protein beta-barrel domain-containing protein n=1 Tax=Spongiibacter thalassae TaxID=2721624 RepID=A0ABX1GCE6_9GAMM|nr:hypothetical protein [Spongiibacter thalassae]NKI15939.1 hypothetical protein [Spongiibacter thalassae]